LECFCCKVLYTTKHWLTIRLRKGILVVDDEHDITLTLQIGLEEDGGFDVDAFTDPERALSRFEPDLYDLVLIDIKRQRWVIVVESICCYVC
jgi:PleD family two-component response regulator